MRKPVRPAPETLTDSEQQQLRQATKEAAAFGQKAFSQLRAQRDASKAK